MARRTVFVPLLCLLLCCGIFWQLPCVFGEVFTGKTEIRHQQVVFYLVDLHAGDEFSVNATTFFNSSIKAYLLTERPVEDTVNPAHINCSDTDDNENSTTLYIISNVTKIFYIEFIQQDDKTDFLLVNASISPDRDSFTLTRYYIPFIAGYPILETLLAITAAIFIVLKVSKRGKKSII